MNRIKIIVTGCLSVEVYRNRMISFLEYGLLNPTPNIDLVLLLGPLDEADNLISHISYSIFRSTSDSHIVKICEYLLHLIDSDIENCWYFKVDDDSATDVRHLMENMKRYDLESPYFLVSRHAKFWSPCDQKAIVDAIGATDFKSMTHEWECAIFNGQYLKKLSEYSPSRQIIQNRIACKSGLSDQLLGALACLSGIRPKVVDFITEKPLLDDFSYFGGKLSHIHYIAPDVNVKLFRKLKRNKQLRDIKFR